MKLAISLILLSCIALAEDMIPKKEEVNHCLDPQAAEDNEGLVRKHSTDISLVRLASNAHWLM